MKAFLFIFCISAALASCSKKGVAPVNLVGTWELRHYSGTIAGVNRDVPTGSGSMLQFKADSTFQHFTNFKADENGRFRIIKNGISWGTERHDAIYLGQGGDPSFLILKADSLTIGNTFADGITALYLRTK